MWPFSKRLKKSEKKVYVPTVRECNHKYKDFPWYTDGKYDYNTKVLEVSVKEPYVCIHCGHRKDVVLDHFSRIFYDFAEADKFYEDFQNSHYTDKMQPRIIVEDMINDMVLVDRQYLDIYMKLHGERFDKNEKSEANLSLPG